MLFVHSVKWGLNVNISVKEKVGLSGGGGGGSVGSLITAISVYVVSRSASHYKTLPVAKHVCCFDCG